MINPEIRIKKSFLLNDKVVPLLQPELQATHRENEGNDDFIDQKVREYKDAWSPYEARIISALCDVLGVEFKQNIIDIYVAPFINSMSDPMIISTKYSSDRVIDVITHEIAHRLLTDNTHLPLSDGKKLSEHWTESFGNHPFKTLVHIPVHALLEYIFIDVLNEPERLQRDMDFCKKFEAYDEAWKYVQAIGYKVIIDQIRSIYKA